MSPARSRGKSSSEDGETTKLPASSQGSKADEEPSLETSPVPVALQWLVEFIPVPSSDQVSQFTRLATLLVVAWLCCFAKQTIIEFAQFVCGVVGWFSAQYISMSGADPFGGPIVPPPLPPLLCHVDTWSPAIQVGASDLDRLAKLVQDLEIPILPTRTAFELQILNVEFQTEMVRSLATGRFAVKWLVEEIRADAVSQRCWENGKSKDESSWLDRWRDDCRGRLIRQTKRLLFMLQAVHQTRSGINMELLKNASYSLAKVHKYTCTAANKLRNQQARLVVDKEASLRYKGSDRQDVTDLATALGKAANTVDSICQMIKVDDNRLADIRRLMEKEVKLLEASINGVGGALDWLKVETVGSQSLAEGLEKKVLTGFAGKWLELTEAYYD
ncbi:hypothetical protein FDECE_5200 [Fusarium decemcellulare]|nr:hypothetical protein FDECE_5200 [Fusarium decemcellulare]